MMRPVLWSVIAARVTRPPDPYFDHPIGNVIQSSALRRQSDGPRQLRRIASNVVTSRRFAAFSPSAQLANLGGPNRFHKKRTVSW
jgi:hypothetical protein